MFLVCVGLFKLEEMLFFILVKGLVRIWCCSVVGSVFVRGGWVCKVLYKLDFLVIFFLIFDMFGKLYLFNFCKGLFSVRV